jgi:hypothetical protein
MKGRSIGAVFGGIVSGAIIAYFLWIVVQKMYPINEETLKAFVGNRKAYNDFYHSLPIGFHLSGIAIGVIRLAAGLIIARLIDRTNFMTLIVVSVFSLLLAVLNVLAFAHPIWYGFVYIPLIIGTAFGYMYLKRKA